MGEVEGEIQQCEERLLYLCDQLTSSLRHPQAREGQASPAKLAAVLGSTFSGVVELMLGMRIQAGLRNLVPGPQLLSALAMVHSMGRHGHLMP